MSVKAKKHLGQHFLKDERIAKNIADALTEKGYENVLEIGPGKVLSGLVKKINRDVETNAATLENHI